MQISVLIVEDDITFSLMLKTWLGKKGFQVETAASVADAKKKFEEAKAQVDDIVAEANYINLAESEKAEAAKDEQ